MTREEDLIKIIKELEQHAMEAYKESNFNLENIIDKQLKSLQDELKMIPIVEKPSTPEECREHHFNQENVNRFGNDRCSKCNMQYRYWREGLWALDKWTEEEKKTDIRGYQHQQEYFKCKVHKHAKME